MPRWQGAAVPAAPPAKKPPPRGAALARFETGPEVKGWDPWRKGQGNPRGGQETAPGLAPGQRPASCVPVPTGRSPGKGGKDRVHVSMTWHRSRSTRTVVVRVEGLPRQSFPTASNAVAWLRVGTEAGADYGQAFGLLVAAAAAEADSAAGYSPPRAGKRSGPESGAGRNGRWSALADYPMAGRPGRGYPGGWRR